MGDSKEIYMILKENKKLEQKEFKNEKELQKYFENNLEKILGYKFIDTEFPVGDFRIDTLAFDPESKSFRIIEYKNVKNHSLVDQGYTYLKMMLERKADFVLQYNIKTNSKLTIQNIDWSQSRIIFVSPTYTPYQLNATDFINAVSGQTICYELATPQIIQLTPQQLALLEGYNILTTDVDTINLRYIGTEASNVQAEIDEFEESTRRLAGSLAMVETSPATANHAVGDLIVFNNQLYKVTVAIASGEVIVVGTNVQSTTIADELKAILAQLSA